MVYEYVLLINKHFNPNFPQYQMDVNVERELRMRVWKSQRYLTLCGGIMVVCIPQTLTSLKQYPSVMIQAKPQRSCSLNLLATIYVMNNSGRSGDQSVRRFRKNLWSWSCFSFQHVKKSVKCKRKIKSLDLVVVMPLKAVQRSCCTAFAKLYLWVLRIDREKKL
jgi:hypothetical protein